MTDPHALIRFPGYANRIVSPRRGQVPPWRMAGRPRNVMPIVAQPLLSAVEACGRETMRILPPS
jgi:hypothetical protein